MNSQRFRRAQQRRPKVKVAAFDGAPWLLMLASALVFGLWQVVSH
ncbi:hypothetical protein [Oleidesulfovibrio sp.]